MDPTLSKSDAHRVFGDLYRRSRSPELQAKVDAIVATTSDIFVRIKRIEELDEAEEHKARADRIRERGGPVVGPAGGRGASGAGPTPGGPAGQAKRTTEAPGGGLFSRLFGGPVARWGKDTRTLQTSGLLGLNFKLDPAAVKVFELEDESIAALSKVFRVLGGNAFEAFEPLRFNLLMSAYQFFTEFVKSAPAFRTAANAEEWITATIKLQKFYALLLKYPNYRKVLAEDIPELAARYEPLQPFLPRATKLLQHLANLDQRKPTLRNVILAHYVLARNQVVGWEVVEREVQVGEPEKSRYRAPKEVIDRIYARISELQAEIRERQVKLDEIATLKERFFAFDDKGRLRVDFLVPVITAGLQHAHPNVQVSDAMVRTYSGDPVRLLPLLIRDFDHNYATIFTGSVALKSGAAHPEDVLLFKQGLFRKQIDDLNLVTRAVDSFGKKFPNFQYTFTDLARDARRPPAQEEVREFLSVVSIANRWFLAVARPLRMVLENHLEAMRQEEGARANEALKRTIALPIETFSYERRFLPYYNREFAAGGRLAQRTVHDVVFGLTRNLYNYLLLYRDPELSDLLASQSQLNQEVETFEARLKRMGVGAGDERPGE